MRAGTGELSNDGSNPNERFRFATSRPVCLAAKTDLHFSTMSRRTCISNKFKEYILLLQGYKERMQGGNTGNGGPIMSDTMQAISLRKSVNLRSFVSGRFDDVQNCKTSDKMSRSFDLIVVNRPSS